MKCLPFKSVKLLARSMEYFRIVKVQTTELQIQQKLGLSNLEEMTSLLFNLETPTKDKASIGGMWGEFTLTRNEIKGGLRFALVECPNALCWTITTGYPPDREAIVIHLTINRRRKDDEFIEEIEEFLDDHAVCLSEVFAQVSAV